ncbi:MULTISPECIES: ComEC/Rec2 family competence protein [Rhizobium/Agrobacterium group]|uniref:ComEC/Rec2 family competence protein n=1 Tax=Rhizobium/Agrobacterium group TaxID=227290 RepID=UPI00056FDF49|nr:MULTISPECIES: ComEC/Rec2 family competence protein [Rhizobium/Agrobacterium group]AKC07065.1 membrane protein [Agrobacterium tumefaciens]AYM15970.1 membrane protein [Agrobacterium tumefaciens]AYM67206.1 membrane protein [Agrobacterium tumefaciens]NIB54799.1 ComEC family competence protein [Agrobacterium tumefaciens]NSY68802.1 ComEC family competence protein [Agrobacterium tumefaciens]
MQGDLPGTREILFPLRRSSDAATHDTPAIIPEINRNTTLVEKIATYLAEERAFGHDFLFIPVSIGCGAVLWFSLDATPSPVILIATFLFVAVLALFVRYKAGIAAAVCGPFAFLLLGMLLADFETRRAGTVVLDTPVTTTITGTVARREVDARGYWRYVIDLTATSDPTLSRPPQRISVLSRGGGEPIALGATLRGKVRLSPPSGPALPGLNDFAFTSYFRGIGATGFFYKSPDALVSPVGDARADKGWLEWADMRLYGLRSAIAERIRTTIGGDAGAFAASIITDERQAISAETMEALRLSGLAHIVAISGLNMALASGIFFVGLRLAFSLFPAFAQRWPVKKIAAFAALLMTLAYYLISGFAVSAERAWLMMSVMLIAVLFDQPSLSLRNVAISALIILAFSPSEIMGPSFQMSFAATIALVSAYAFWSRWRTDRERLFIGRKPAWLKVAEMMGAVIGGVITTSLIGGLSTAIYSVEHFHRVTTYGLFANLAAMPLMSLIVMPFALIAMLLMPFGLDAPFLKIMGYGMALVIEVANEVASWGGSAATGRPHGWFIGLASVGFLLLTLLRSRLALLGIPFLLLAFGVSAVTAYRDLPDLLIHEDGELVALVEDGKVSTTKARPQSFVYGQWQRALLLPEKIVPPGFINGESTANTAGSDSRSKLSPEDMAVVVREMTAALKDAKAGVFTCRKDIWCVASAASGEWIVVLEDGRFAGKACDIADIVVVSRRTSFSQCRSGALLLSRDILRRLGSVEIDFADKREEGVASGLRAAIAGTDRPWSQHRYYDWKSGRFDRDLPQPIIRLLAASQ